MGSILDENPGGAGPFSGGKLTTAQKKSRRARKERLERAMAARANWSPEQHAAEEARLQAEVEEMLETRRHAA
ncbi:MAG: hypothetical protein RID23_04470 [Roseovarius sp.]